jgi:hypothetical protein
MAVNSPYDRSNGYEDKAERFMVSRNARIGAAEVSGLMFLLPATFQPVLIGKVAKALRHGARSSSHRRLLPARGRTP